MPTPEATAETIITEWLKEIGDTRGLKLDHMRAEIATAIREANAAGVRRGVYEERMREWGWQR